MQQRALSNAPAAGRAALPRRHPVAAAARSAPEQAPPASQPLIQAGSSSSRRQLLQLGCACCSAQLLQLGLASRPAAAAAETASFSYGEEAGPLAWGGLCRTGTQQSPINIPVSSSSGCSSSSSQELVFNYRASNRVRVKNTGTTIQVNFEPSAANSITWHGTQLQLLQYHFHTPSEHSIDGQRAAMEAHLVHRNADTGGFAVVGVLLQPPEGGGGTAQPCLAAALAHVPGAPKDEAACPVPVNPLSLLPVGAGTQPRPFVHYTGSLTTPPCSEGVEWLVLTEPLPVSDAQVLDFMRFTGGGATYGHNARPLQAAAGRVLQYDCLVA